MALLIDDDYHHTTIVTLCTEYYLPFYYFTTYGVLYGVITVKLYILTAYYISYCYKVLHFEVEHYSYYSRA